MIFRVESGVPLPEKRHAYPWALLEVGQSFLVPYGVSGRQRVWNTLTSCRRNAQKSGKRFAIRSVANGLRVWRTA